MRNDPEKLIDRVLSGLRDVEPAPGLERRVLEALESREQRTVLPPSPRQTRRRLWTLALAGLATACLIVAAIHQPSRSAPTPAAPLRQAKATVEEPAATLPEPSLQPVRGVRPGSFARRVHATVTHPPAQGDASRAASFPAPPLPLTEQEKLLQRLVHKGDPVQMAMLNPETRARQNAEGKAEFQRFFDPNKDPHKPGENQ